MIVRANWRRHHRLVGLVVGAIFGLLLGAPMLGYVALFDAREIHNGWAFLSIMVAVGALSGLVQQWKAKPS